MALKSLLSECKAGNPKLALVLISVWLVMFSIILTGLPDLNDNEARVGAYVFDAVSNGNWMIQQDLKGDLASKPPMLTWLIGLTAVATGKLSVFSVYFPTALATLVVALVIFKEGSRRLGELAGFLGGLAYLLSEVAESQMATARYDGLFALPVLLAGLAAHRAWVSGRGWTWFWLAAAAATLVNGPLGVLLGAAGLVAVLWEWKSADALRPRGNHLPGIALYFLICGGWFGLAYLQVGQPLIDKMIFRELVGHSIASKEGGVGARFYEPTYNLIVKFLPWSLLGVLGFQRAWRMQSPDPDVRRFERFLVCWIIVGLIVFSVSSHQRARLVMPLVPPLALLAGHEFSRRVSNWRSVTLRSTLAGFTAIALSGLAFQRHVLMARDKNVQESLALYAMADSIRDKVGGTFPLTYMETSTAFQFCMGTCHPFVSADEAANLLGGDSAVFVVVQDMQSLREARGAEATPLYELMVHEIRGGQTLSIVSNHPKLEWAQSMDTLYGHLRIHTEGAELGRNKGNDYEFECPDTDAPTVQISNGYSSPQRVKISLHISGATTVHGKLLAPGETWQISSRSYFHDPVHANQRADRHHGG